MCCKGPHLSQLSTTPLSSSVMVWGPMKPGQKGSKPSAVVARERSEAGSDASTAASGRRRGRVRGRGGGGRGRGLLSQRCKLQTCYVSFRHRYVSAFSCSRPLTGQGRIGCGPLCLHTFSHAHASFRHALYAPACDYALSPAKEGFAAILSACRACCRCSLSFWTRS